MKRALRGRLLLAVVGTLGGLVVGEVVVRLVSPQIFAVHAPGMYVEDPELGYAPTPGFEGAIERSEYRFSFTIGAAGLRGADPRSSATYRILVLGDSQAFGFGVADHETFSVRLEELLRERYVAADIQVLNAGVPGYGTADELAMLETRGPVLRPDLVVVQFLSVNDLQESRVPARDWAEVRDGFLGSRLSETKTTAPLWQRLQWWVKSNSNLARLVLDLTGYLGTRFGNLGRVDALWGEDFTSEDARRGEELLSRIVYFARALGARTQFLYTTGQAQVIQASYEPLPSSEVVARAAELSGAPWIDVTAALRERPDRLELYYAKDGHWTARGHQAVAELLFREIVERGWITEVAEQPAA